MKRPGAYVVSDQAIRTVRERAFFAGAIIGSAAGAAIVGICGLLFALGIVR